MDIASPQTPASGTSNSNYASVLAQKAIQQITEPVQLPAKGIPTVPSAPIPQQQLQQPPPPLINQQPPLLPTQPPPPQPKEPINFVHEIQSMLYSFGDSRRPRLETAILVDHIVRQQLVEIVYRATDASMVRGANGVIGIEDVLFLMRKNPIKVQRFVKYFKAKDLSSQVVISQQGGHSFITDTNKRARRCRDFLLSIDAEGGLLTQAINEELVDEVRMNRLRRRDRFTRQLDEKRYAEFTRARHISFIGHNMRFASKFREWVLNDINATSVEDPLAAGGDPQQSSGQIQMDATGLEALGYLAYETVGAITEMALVARQDADPTNKLDPVHRVMAPVAYNSTYPMVQIPMSPSEDNARRMLGSRKEEDSVWTYPLETQHIHEAMRRLSQRPVSALGWHRRLETRKTPMTLVAI